MPKSFLPEITKILGIPRTTLLKWMDLGYIRPSIQRRLGPSGQGVSNLYSLGDVYHGYFFKLLMTEYGLKREAAFHVAYGLDMEHFEKFFDADYAVIKPEKVPENIPKSMADQFRYGVAIMPESGRIGDINSRTAILLNLRMIKQDIQQAIKKVKQ